MQKLTVKEKIVLTDLIKNVPQVATAAEQGISERQVKRLRAQIRRKLNARTNHDLILKLIDPSGVNTASAIRCIDQT